jgi:hypothetical protein
MSFNFKVGGSWETLASGWVKIAGTWQQVQSAWVKVAGTWQQVYANLAFALSGTTGSPNTVTTSDTAANWSGWRFSAAGNVFKNETGSFTAFNFGTEYANTTPPATWIRITANAGDNPSTGISLGVWLEINVDRDFIWNRSTLGNTAGSVKVEISSDSGGSTILATGYYGGDATVTL